MATRKTTYNESDIGVLKGLEPVQHRPGMYTRTESPNHIMQEVADNAFDEAQGGYANKVSVELFEDGSVSIEDNGRGIPVGLHPTEKRPTVEVVFTILHAGGKFKKGDGSAYKFTGGLHGVGVSVTNALSEKLEVTVWRDGYEHRLVFSHGAVVEQLSKKKLPADQKDRTGTRVHAWPAAEYFESAHVHVAEFERFLRSKAVLLPGVEVSWTRPNRPTTTWCFPGGMTQYLEEQIEDAESWLAPRYEVDLHHEKSTDSFDEGEGFKLALGFTGEGRTIRESYVNLIPTPNGGRHENGLRSGLFEAVRAVAERNGALPKGVKLEADDIWSRASFVLSTQLSDPQFQNQTKDKMTSPKAQTLVQGLLRDNFELWLGDHPEAAKAIVEMAVNEAVRRSKAAVKAERKKGSSAAMLPGKLADCESKDVNNTELFLVEGDSAGGCFLGSTLVKLADGRSVSIEQIAHEQAQGMKHYGYTINSHGSIEISEFINARLTKHSAPLVKVHLDNGEEIVCTPDHRFMLRDGSYLAATLLEEGQSLMPYYERVTDPKNHGARLLAGYHQVINPASGKWRYSHILADEFNIAAGLVPLERGYHRHHKDFNKLNNNPSNIQQMQPQDHLRLHIEHADIFLRSEAAQAKALKTRQSAEFREKMSELMSQPHMSEMLSARAKAQWEDPEYKKFMISRWKEFYCTNEEYRIENNRLLNEGQKQYWASEENRVAQSERTRSFFEANPSYKEKASEFAKAQWSDKDLRTWRAETTAKQWTPEFRAVRKKAMDKHYFERTMHILKKSLSAPHSGEISIVEGFEKLRTEQRDRYVMKIDRFAQKFFDGNVEAVIEAAEHFNHKVVKVEVLDWVADVYDLEVPGTHNFALAHGVFVHNSSKQGRDRTKQAILPLRGKLLNTWDVDSHKALASETIHNIASAIGVDPHTGKKAADVDLSRLRYGKVFIMADADVDGQHIQVLLLTLFFRHFPALIEKGYIWIAQAPLFRVDAPAKKGTKTGPRKIYVLDERELDAVSKQLTKEGLNDTQWSVTRFKGLGEMNADQLGETTMNPDGRRALRIHIEDAEKAAEAFDLMMNSKNAKARRDWMEAEGASVDID